MNYFFLKFNNRDYFHLNLPHVAYLYTMRAIGSARLIRFEGERIEK